MWFCKLLAKTEWATEGVYGRFLKESAICGHALEAGMGWHLVGDGDRLPPRDTDWRIKGVVDNDAYNFIEMADVPFSVEAARQAVKAGTQLVAKYDDVRLASRRVQEIHMRPMASQAQSYGELVEEEPEFGGQIARLHEPGEQPQYGGPSPGAVRSSVLPYGESKTHPMVSKLWGDVGMGRLPVVHAGAIRAETPMTPTPTATAVGKFPDRAISADVGIISDLGIADLFLREARLP